MTNVVFILYLYLSGHDDEWKSSTCTGQLIRCLAYVPRHQSYGRVGHLHGRIGHLHGAWLNLLELAALCGM